MNLTVTSLDEDFNVIAVSGKDMNELFSVMNSQMIKRWQLEDFLGDVRISTVFIPRFNIMPFYNFETATIINGKFEIINRYKTAEEATKGHNAHVAKLQNQP